MDDCQILSVVETLSGSHVLIFLIDGFLGINNLFIGRKDKAIILQNPIIDEEFGHAQFIPYEYLFTPSDVDNDVYLWISQELPPWYSDVV